MKNQISKLGFSVLFFILCFVFSSSFLFSEDEVKKESVSASVEAPASQAEPVLQPEPVTEDKLEEQAAVVQTASPGSQNVTLDFKEADIRNVLKIISYKSGVNIVTTPEVIGNVTIRLVDVPWEKALEVILKTYGFAYDRIGGIITVAPLEKLTALKKQEVELSQVQPTVTEVFNLKYIDAQDAKKALDPQLSPRGKITVLEMTGQAGWEFGATEIAKRKRAPEEKMARSKVLIISDVPPIVDKIREVVAQLDVMPPQVLVEARIMEVSKDKLKDLGVEWGTGPLGASQSAITATPTSKDSAGNILSQIGGHILSDTNGTLTPSIFGPKEGTAMTTLNTGLRVVFQKLTGNQFEAVLHALEEDVHTNTLSAPRIVTLNNQEASILVGTKYPILSSEVSSQAAGQTVSVTLDYYQDVGIQLNVVPQVGANNYINMVVHPAVSTTSATSGSVTTASYPVIEIREAETRVLIKDGDTIVIGGLLKDVKSHETIGIPFLSKIPFLGKLFQRETNDDAKIDLLIFITAHIVKEGEFAPEEIAKLEKRFEKPNKDKAKKVDSVKVKQ